MTYEEHYKSLIKDLNQKFPELVKQYQLSVCHSGGGCFHVEMTLGGLNILINPFKEDIEYNVPETKNTNCIFGVYDEHGEEQKTFFKSFEKGLKYLMSVTGQHFINGFIKKEKIK